MQAMNKEEHILKKRMCGHPEMIRYVELPSGRLTLAKHQAPPAEVIYSCECGENWSCPVCGHGQGAMPCTCRRERDDEEEAAIWASLPDMRRTT